MKHYLSSGVISIACDVVKVIVVAARVIVRARHGNHRMPSPDEDDILATMNTVLHIIISMYTFLLQKGSFMVTQC
ncbi:hypothetical protein AVEN_132808-1, partial [Araneus ventricosus]